MAAIAGHAGTDLWHYKAGNGRSLKLAWDFLAPYLSEEKTWPYKSANMLQAGKIGVRGLPWLRQAAKVYYRDGEYARMTKKLMEASPDNSRAAWLEGAFQ
jgi:hypothetical protein